MHNEYFKTHRLSTGSAWRTKSDRPWEVCQETMDYLMTTASDTFALFDVDSKIDSRSQCLQPLSLRPYKCVIFLIIFKK